MSEQLIATKELSSCHSLQRRHDNVCLCKAVFAEELDAYQYLQMKHDEIYHREIFVLSISQRMNHVALHLVKYLASLFSFPVSAAENRKAFIDSFIMVVSASNLLGLSLSKHLVIHEENNFDEDFIKEYIKLLSNLAKACEAADHQEDYPIRASWNKNIQDFFSLLVCEANLRNVSLLEEAITRLTSVEKAHPLNDIFWKKE